ncbi:MAG: response regulator [Lachnospiraceae bacterium]|jgi:two-component system sensor histidine kinase/response regulator|nr:response regulator [Lachnospiraceae bacterium]
MKNKTIRFLQASLILVSILCVAIFTFLALYMNRKSAGTISEVGNIYMSGMNERIILHFKTTIEMRLSHVEDMEQMISSGNYEDSKELQESLIYSAQARGFAYLAFFSQDGDFQMLYGEPLQVIDPPPFLRSLNNGEKKVAVGVDAQGNNVVLMGVSAVCTMEGGKECTAIVAGLPVEYISNMLSLDQEDALVYSHIIRRDGSFVIKSAGAFRDNYFERIQALMQENRNGAETYIQEMMDAMNADEDYSAVVHLDQERRHLYCTKLPYSEWFLVTVMPFGALDKAVNRLGLEWEVMGLGGCIIILAALVAVFIGYYRLTRQQIRQLEEARQEALMANKAKSEFLSNMSHDIRTPMNAIVGMTAIAIANMDNMQQVQNCLRKIALSSKHLLGLINDVLDMSKIESGKMTLNMDQVSLREVMDSIVSIVQPQVKAKNQKFDVSIHDIESENVLCDSVRLNQIMLNLLSNAIKFTSDGGSIRVAMYEEESPKGEEFVRIHFHVEDNGIGMTPEFREKIFESFTREDSARVRKTEGTGLGMTITKYIIDAMGGTIQVKSELGEGTEFHVILDLEKAEIQEADMILPKWNMLVVDDDRQLCESTVSALKSIGIDADWTLDGQSAIEMVKRSHEKHEDYHIILLDWKLPDMDGIETAKRIRRYMGDQVPILLISAYDWSEIEDSARSAGVTGFIGKPLFKSTLYHGLRPYAEGIEQAQEATELSASLNGIKILLAEDNDLNWEIAEELLSELGMELERAENGQICIDMFQNSEVGYYNAVLMDLRMPVMTGYEAAWGIRKLDREDSDIPIIAMTADAFSEDIKRCLDCGMNAHVAKPIDVQEVARLLEKFIFRKE